MPFTVYIDESGEAGIAKFRDGDKPGASKYFVLGAMVAQPASQILARKRFEQFRAALAKEKWRHATELNHQSKVFIAREMSKLHVRYFAVISNKATLGNYKGFINSDAQKYYNKCLMYLLENVCSYLIRFGVKEDDLSVVLEARNHDYDAMLRYIQKVRERPLYPQSRSLRTLNPFAISTLRKGEDNCLEIADFVSHAVYQCVNKTPSNFNIPETRYFREISPRFACDENGLIGGIGLKYIHDIDMLELDDDVRHLFINSRAQLPQRV